MFEHVTDTRYIPLALLYGVGGRMQFADLMNQAVTLSGLDILRTKSLLNTMRGQSLWSSPARSCFFPSKRRQKSVYSLPRRKRNSMPRKNVRRSLATCWQ